MDDKHIFFSSDESFPIGRRLIESRAHRFSPAQSKDYPNICFFINHSKNESRIVNRPGRTRRRACQGRISQIKGAQATFIPPGGSWGAGAPQVVLSSGLSFHKESLEYRRPPAGRSAKRKHLINRRPRRDRQAKRKILMFCFTTLG